MLQKILLTKEGYNKILADYDYLTSVRRREVAEKFKEALSYGDISENSEYDFVKNEQVILEDKILQLENMLRNAEIINTEKNDGEFIRVGCRIHLKNIIDGSEIEYIIVGPAEADPFSGKISNVSPLGQALLGRKKGDSLEFSVPDGISRYEILDVLK